MCEPGTDLKNQQAEYNQLFQPVKLRNEKMSNTNV